MSKKKKLVLGYTRNGIEVFLPTNETPAREDFVGWSQDDHDDAAHILQEHSEREVEPQVGSWCKSWASAHQTTSKPPRRNSSNIIRGAAETVILSRHRKR